MKSPYCLTQKEITKVRDDIDSGLKYKRHRKKVWININKLVAEAYHRGKGDC